MRLTYYGHSCFSLENEGVSLLFDPFIDENPLCEVDSSQVKAHYILVSHWHTDHMKDLLKIAKAQGSLVVSTYEVAIVCEARGVKAHAMHLGGKAGFDFGFVRVTPAFHGSGIPGGHACGFIVDFFGQVLYFAGDTALFGDMELLRRLENIETALLPIGDNFTMGIDDAVIATEFIRPRLVVPMHYNTNPQIQCDPQVFKEKVEQQTGSRCQVIPPGGSLELG